MVGDASETLLHSSNHVRISYHIIGAQGAPASAGASSFPAGFRPLTMLLGMRVVAEQMLQCI